MVHSRDGRTRGGEIVVRAAGTSAETSSTSDTIISVGSTLSARLGELTRDLLMRISSEIEHLGDDDRLLELMAASVRSNVEAITHIFAHSIEIEGLQAPAAALEYSRRLAQHRIPVNSLVRAYRLGQDSFLRWSLHELERQSPAIEDVAPAAQRLVATTSAYIDRVTQQVIEAYEDEHQNWLAARNYPQPSQIRDFLNTNGADASSFERTVGYRLHQWHLGLVLWVDQKSMGEGDVLPRIEKMTISLAERSGCREQPLLVPCDELSAWIWLPFGSDSASAMAAALEKMSRYDTSIKVAVGDPGFGSDGFGRTHLEALQVLKYSVTAGRHAPRVASFAHAGPIALMCSDLDATRRWVAKTLGPLAVDDEPHERLRETVRSFLGCSGSYTASATALAMHKNTVQYRLKKAEEELGRPIRENRLDLEIALTICHRLRSAVLLPPQECAVQAPA